MHVFSWIGLLYFLGSSRSQASDFPFNLGKMLRLLWRDSQRKIYILICVFEDLEPPCYFAESRFLVASYWDLNAINLVISFLFFWFLKGKFLRFERGCSDHFK